MAVNCVFCQVGVPERNTDLTKNIESPDILHNGHRYRGCSVLLVPPCGFP